jgi:hypothetical protein
MRARAVLEAEAKDIPALAKRFAENGALILGAMTPRERGLARALRRMGRTQPKSIYREPSKPMDSADEGGLADWVAKVAPQAAAFARDGRARVAVDARDDDVAANPKALDAIQTERAATAKAMKPALGKRWKRVLALWLVLVVMFVAIWQFLAVPTEAPHARSHVTHAPPPSTDPDLVGLTNVLAVVFFVLVGALLFVIVPIKRRRIAKRTEKLNHAARLVARGDLATAQSDFEVLAQDPVFTISAQAHLGLAGIAERRARFEEALAHAGRAIGRIGTGAAARAMSSDILLPECIALRAFALAALGRNDEARAEMEMLGRESPTYPYLSRARFRVRLAIALRKTPIDVNEVLAAARDRATEMPLTLREETLADAIELAYGEGATEDEIARVADDLADEELGAWVEALAPNLRGRINAMRGARTRVVEPRDDEVDDVSDAKEEAAAPRRMALE